MKISNLIGESINCKSCGKILKQPVVLPCGHSICKHHETEDNNQNIECIKCNKSFEIPADGFAPNCDLESLLVREINELDLGDEYNSVFHKFTQFQDLLEHFNRVKKDPEIKIHTVINELKNNVDLRREELKGEIDKEAMKMIEEIDEFEKQCKSNVSLIKSDIDLDVKLKVWAYDLTNWKRSLNSFKRDINKWVDLSTEIIMDLQTEYLKFNDELFLNRLNDFWPQLSIMSNFQTIRVEVKELSKLKDFKKCKQLISNKVYADEIEWELSVSIKCGKSVQPNEKSSFIKVNLYSDICKITSNYNVDFDLVFLDQLGMGKSYIKSFSYKNYADYDDYNSKFAHLIKLNDLMEDYNLYNIKKDSCIVEAIIKTVELF